MSIKYTDFDRLQINEITDKLEKVGEFSCIIPYTSRESDLFFSSVLRSVLQIINQEQLHSHLEYAVNKLTTNASKANSKRIYFESRELDINDSSQYSEGMKSFKQVVFEDFSRFEEDHRKKNAYVAVKFQITDDSFRLIVESPASFLKREIERIRERMEIARKFESLAEVFTYGFDDSEGAGFGLILVMLMLRKVNLDEKALLFGNTDRGSKTTLSVPLNLLSAERGGIIAGYIAEEIKQMPQFPSNIQNLQRELANPDCTFESIADFINSDTTLTAEILRIANSPVYRVRNKIIDVASAVRVMGLLGVKSILYNYGMMAVMRKRYNDSVVNDISQHSFVVALIGSFIARYKKIEKIAEDVYISAMLHDMGKIIINSLNTNLESRLENLCREKHIPLSVLDDLTEGYNHALIGAEVAKKWDFPEKLIRIIKYHHLPLEVGGQEKAVCYTLYLANEIFHYEEGNRDFHDINYMVLSFFGLEQFDQFHKLIDELKIEGLLM